MCVRCGECESVCVECACVRVCVRVCVCACLCVCMHARACISIRYVVYIRNSLQQQLQIPGHERIFVQLQNLTQSTWHGSTKTDRCTHTHTHTHQSQHMQTTCGRLCQMLKVLVVEDLNRRDDLHAVVRSGQTNGSEGGDSRQHPCQRNHVTVWV